jgi:hypothetical protein
MGQGLSCCCMVSNHCQCVLPVLLAQFKPQQTSAVSTFNVVSDLNLSQEGFVDEKGVQIIAWMYLYYLTVSNFGNLIALIKVPWYLGIATTFHAAGGAIVEVWFHSTGSFGRAILNN